MTKALDCKGRPVKVGDAVIVFPSAFLTRDAKAAEDSWGDRYKWLYLPFVIEQLDPDSELDGIIVLNGGLSSINPFGVHIDSNELLLIPSINLSREELSLYLALEGSSEGIINK